MMVSEGEVEGSRPMALGGSARTGSGSRGVAFDGIGSGMCVHKS
jgi:hypothetical protein